MTIAKRLFFLATLCSALAPLTARADITLSASVGKAFQLTPSVRGEPTTLMVAPGITLLDKVLRLEVGFAMSFPDLGGGLPPPPVDIQLRPAVVISPPAFPLYLRVFGVVDSIIHAVRILPGAALGASFGVGPVAVFLEVGALPRFSSGSTDFLLEPRGGVMFSF